MVQNEAEIFNEESCWSGFRTQREEPAVLRPLWNQAGDHTHTHTPVREGCACALTSHTQKFPHLRGDMWSQNPGQVRGGLWGTHQQVLGPRGSVHTQVLIRALQLPHLKPNTESLKAQEQKLKKVIFIQVELRTEC